MVVPGLMHFIFTYHFLGVENHTHAADIYAKGAEDAELRFRDYMVNAPRYEIEEIKAVEQF